jgi:fructokinase
MKILSFGEILWDIFGEKKEIGGAPFNFSAHMAKLGADVCMVSALGNDELGESALKFVRSYGIHTDYIAVSEKPTGYCKVTLAGKTPRYDLVPGVAYDFIPCPAVSDAFDAFYMGTLAQRNDISRLSLEKLLCCVNAKEVFFDINIRQSYYTKEIIESCLQHTSILKISREEMHVFSELGIADASSPEELCASLAERFPLKIILVTLDKDGAMLYICKEKSFLYSRKPECKVVSTVGAGDSFSACFLYNYLNGASLDVCLDRAVTLSDYVVTKLGAIPEYDEGLESKIK